MKKSTTYLKNLLLAILVVGGLSAKAQMCAANFTFTNLPGGAVSFTSTSLLTTSLTTYYWSFGNGGTFSATGNPGVNALTTYTANGSYVVTLFIFSTVPTCSSGISYTVNVTNSTACALNANFNYFQGSSGLVNFNNITTGTIVGTTFLWNFGDNSATSTLTFPSHTYSANGVYVATLVATNSSTCTSTRTLNINVTSYCNVVASFTTTQGSNGLVNFQSTSTGTLPGYIHNWVFGDGSSVNAGPTTSHTYTNGTYFAILTVKNNSISPTCQDSASALIVVSSNTCFIQANFTHSVSAGGLVNFYNTSTGTISSSTYTWNFGNGFTSNVANPSLSFSSGGVYNVSLIVRNSPTCSSLKSNTVNVNTIPCVANANFTLVPTGTPQFWSAVPAYPWNVTGASWTWGDGTVNTGSLYASHQYTSAGMYTICLTVTVNCGATASTCSSYSVFRTTEAMSIININVTPPALASIDAGSTTGISKSEISNSEILIYPNPNSGSFMLKASELKDSKASISVYNIVGQLVYEKEIEVLEGQFSQNVNIEAAKSGIYFVTLKADKKTITNKIVINN